MKERDYGDFVQDILDSINDVENFIGGMEFEDFIRDKKTIYSVVRAIEIIGEAAKNVPEQVRKKYPDVRATASKIEQLFSDLDRTPFDAIGGRGKMFQLFGTGMNAVISEMNVAVAAA